MAPISGANCEICGDQVCPACQETQPCYSRAAAYGAYEAELRELIHLFRYEQVVPAAAVLGRILAEAIEKVGISADPLLVVPVPLHSSKRRHRGFNQAELIARAALKKKVFANAELAVDILERRRPTVSQIGLARPQRFDSIRGAFRVAHLNRVGGRKVLPVGEVLTTGTTVSECARVLRKAGAEKVLVATVARTLKGAAFGIEAEFETAQAS